jgi:hypothetical protein
MEDNSLGLKISHLQTIFVRYGAGFGLFAPLTKLKWWNAFAWASIVLGVAGWIAFLYFFPVG